MYHHFQSPTEAFLNYFDTELIATRKDFERAARLRYRVYCEEFGYEPAGNFPDQKEFDRFDEHSMHCVITHRGSGETAACVRLICATKTENLPLEEFCLDSIDPEYLDSLTLERRHVCEVSRLAVDPAFRKRPGEGHTQLGEFDAVDCSHQECRTFSLLGIAAVLASFAMSSLADRTNIYTMMEPNLPRLLRRSGILMQQAGEPMSYHGQRCAYFVSSKFAVSNMREDLGALYEAIYARLAYSSDSREHVA